MIKNLKTNRLKIKLNPAQKKYAYAMCLGLIMAAGIILRALCLSLSPMPSGDYKDMYKAAGSFTDSQFIREIKFNPPLHQIPKRVVIMLTDSVGAMRIMFMIFGILIIPTIYITTAKFFSEREGLLAAGFAAFFPGLVRLSISSRGEMLSLLMATIALYFFYDLYYNHKHHYAYIAFTIFAAYSHYYAYSVIIPQLILLYLSRNREARMAVLNIALLSLPAAAMCVAGMSIRNESYFRAASHGLSPTMSSALLAINGISPIFITATVVFIRLNRHNFLRLIIIFAIVASVAVNYIFEVRSFFMYFTSLFVWIVFAGLTSESRSLGRRILFMFFLIMFFVLVIGSPYSTIAQHDHISNKYSQVVTGIESLSINTLIFTDVDQMLEFLGQYWGDPALLHQKVSKIKFRNDQGISILTIKKKNGVPMNLVALPSNKFTDLKRWYARYSRTNSEVFMFLNESHVPRSPSLPYSKWIPANCHHFSRQPHVYICGKH